MNKIDIENRVKELNAASDAYYNSDKPMMNDTEFDCKFKQLKQWEDETGIVLSNSPTQNVGAVVLNNIAKIAHKTPMLSLDKCHSVEEIEKFANGHDLVASVKLDGLTVRLTYEDGNLILAESRGNGTIGGLVTKHVKQFLNVPLHINKKGTYIIDGEALIKLDDFEKINKNGEYKNSRNLASGTLANLDTSVVRDRRMRWYAWEIVEGNSSNDFYYALSEAKNLGFDVVPFYNITTNEFNQLQMHIDNFINIAKEENLPQDGVVFKFEDIEYGKSLGSTTHHFNNGIAYKVANDSVETELINIEYTMGKTGVLTPVAIFKPVEIENTIVERASLHNLSVMNEIMGVPFIGQHIGVYKSNLIIPQIRWAEENIDKGCIPIPDNCPICGSNTKVVSENDSKILMCTNPDCRGKILGKLTHAVNRDALDISGLSESTLDKFISLGWLNSIKDIYHLSEHEDAMKIVEGFGSKSVQKLLESIEKSRSTNLQRFLYSLSIPLLGKTASKLIAEACNYDFDAFIGALQSGGRDAFTYIDGIGEALGKSIIGYWNKNGEAMVELAQEFTLENPMANVKSDNSLDGKIFVITGSVNHYANRNELKADIEAHGGKVSSSISVKTSFLINNDINSTSGKNKKAKELNVPIISEEQFLSMI